MNWKKVPYYIPGVGLVTHTLREYKSRRGKKPWYNLKNSQDRKALSNYFVQAGYLSFAILWKVYAGSYLGKGISKGDWHPFRFNEKNKNEQVNKLVEKKSLEKNLNYYDILK